MDQACQHNVARLQGQPPLSLAIQGFMKAMITECSVRQRNQVFRNSVHSSLCLKMFIENATSAIQLIE